MKKFSLLTALNLFLYFLISNVNASEEFVELQTRPDVTQGIYVVRPAKPVATVILLPGGTGKIKLGADGPKKEGNFLVRTRDLFADNGLMAIVIDAPSDLADTKSGLKNHRINQNHVTDIKAIIDYARKQANIPIWLVGTSRGTISAANVASQLPTAVDGIVLTATVSNGGKKDADSVMDTQLEKITAPVLIAHHKKDRCVVSPSSGVKKVKQRLTSAKLVDVMMIKGGKEKSGKDCKGYSYHGFFKIEEKAVTQISGWIKSH